MNIAELTSAEMLEVFEGQRRDVLQTARYHGLDIETDETPVVIGTGGLALHNVFANVENQWGDGMDLDAVILPKHWPNRHMFSRPIMRSHEASPLVAPVAYSEIHGRLAYRGTGYNIPPIIRKNIVIIGGMATLPAVQLARVKLEIGDRKKDAAGIIQAQLLAWETGHVIAANQDWLEIVGQAAQRYYRPPSFKERFKPFDTPKWLFELMGDGSGYSHPAFDDVLTANDNKVAV